MSDMRTGCMGSALTPGLTWRQLAHDESRIRHLSSERHINPINSFTHANFFPLLQVSRCASPVIPSSTSLSFAAPSAQLGGAAVPPLGAFPFSHQAAAGLAPEYPHWWSGADASHPAATDGDRCSNVSGLSPSQPVWVGRWCDSPVECRSLF